MGKIDQTQFVYDISVPISQRYALIAEKMKNGYTVTDISFDLMRQKEILSFDKINNDNSFVVGGVYRFNETQDLKIKRDITLAPAYRGERDVTARYKHKSKRNTYISNITLIPALNITYRTNLKNYKDIDHYLYEKLDIPITQNLLFSYTTSCGCNSDGINKDITSLDLLDCYGEKISNFFAATNYMNCLYGDQTSMSLNNLFKLRKFVKKYIIDNHIPKNKEENQDNLLKTLQILLGKSKSILPNTNSYEQVKFKVSYKNTNLTLNSIENLIRIGFFKRSLVNAGKIQNILIDLNSIKLINEIDFVRYKYERPIGFKILTDYLLTVDGKVNAFKAMVNKELAKVM